MSSVMLPAQADTPWRRWLPGLLLVAAVLLLFRDTTQAMVAIWLRSDTYAHAFLVLPISLWLAWRGRDRLVGLPVRPAPWVLLPMAVACLLWLVGEMAAAQALTQTALVMLLVLCVPAALGLPVTRVLLFPLLFLFFAVPVGEALVPTMMEWTADFTVATVRMSGVPVYREGFQFIVPSGSWSVVDACSGVRYLIASFMVGTLFAYINYQSPKRRALFVLLSLLVPVLANWVRAYLIVMLGHWSDMKLAAGVDHIIYGWVFFGVVIGLMFFIGARWAEPDAVRVPAAGTSASMSSGTSREGASWWVAAAVLALLAGTQALSWRLDRPSAIPLPKLELPAAWGGGWAAGPASFTSWEPVFKYPRAHASETYASGSDQAAAWVGYYRDQGYENKLITSTNVLAESHTESKWAQALHGTRNVDLPGGPVALRLADVQAALKLGGTATQRLRVLYVYWVGGEFVVSDTRARLKLAVNRLLGRGDDAAVVILYTDTHGDSDDVADARLQRFAAAGLPALAARLDAMRAGR